MQSEISDILQLEDPNIQIDLINSKLLGHTSIQDCLINILKCYMKHPPIEINFIKCIEMLHETHNGGDLYEKVDIVIPILIDCIQSYAFMKEVLIRCMIFMSHILYTNHKIPIFNNTFISVLDIIVKNNKTQKIQDYARVLLNFSKIEILECIICFEDIHHHTIHPRFECSHAKYMHIGCMKTLSLYSSTCPMCRCDITKSLINLI